MRRAGWMGEDGEEIKCGNVRGGGSEVSVVIGARCRYVGLISVLEKVEEEFRYQNICTDVQYIIQA